MIPINPINLTVEQNVTLTVLEFSQVKQATINQMIGPVIIGLYIFFVVGMVFGYQFHKYRMKKIAEAEDGDNS